MAAAELRYTYLAKQTYWRFRHPAVGDAAMPHMRGVSIREQPDQLAFIRKYAELLGRVEASDVAPAQDRRSFRWLILQYRGGQGRPSSEEFRALADSTQLDYNRRSAKGNQYNGNNLGSAIYRAVQAISDMSKNRSLHGLRYAAGSTMEEAGCGVAEIEAVLGRRTFRMALKYASQRRPWTAGLDRLPQDFSPRQAAIAKGKAAEYSNFPHWPDGGVVT